MTSLTLGDFQPFNNWELVQNKGKTPYLLDATTGKKYLYEDKVTIGLQCLILTIGTPSLQLTASIVNIAYRILKLVTLSHFWIHKPEEKSYSIKGRVKDAGLDLLRVVTQPIAVVGLQLSAIYGLFRPYDGRKLYSSIELAQYGNTLFSPF
ncbi:MAG: hypothetical protein WD595_01020 [Waddliaceae bacterium]